MHALEQWNVSPLSPLLVGIAALAAVGLGVVPAQADQDDVAERVPSSAADVYSPIARSFARQPALPGGPISRPRPDAAPAVAAGPVLLEDLKARLSDTNPFWRDAVVNFYTRTHYLDRRNSDVSTSQAWAAGSALAVRSGYFDEWLQLEVAVATSQPVFAPSDEGGTLLLTDQQAEVSSLAVANARMRLAGQELVLGRQLIKTPYINPQDNRMIPNTVEGAVLTLPSAEAKAFDYGVGYLWGFKARGSSYFVPFSEELGVTEDRGVAVAGFKMVPLQGLTFGAIDYHIADTLNTAFAEVDWLTSPSDGLQFRVSANYTDQRSVGENLMAGAPFATSQISGLIAASYCNATLLAAISSNGTGADIIGPFGSFPAYTVLDQLNFNDAGESTVVLGAAYDFSRIVTDGLRFQVRYGMGSGVIDPATGAPQPKQNELNLELVYQPTSGPLDNLYFQFFYSGVKMPGAPAAEESQPQVRSVITYLVPVL